MDEKEVSCLIFLVALSVIAEISRAQVTSLFVDCGTNSTSDVDGRRWLGDSASSSNVSLNNPGVIASIRKINERSTYESLYRTARVFNMTSAYMFKVPAGNYYLRLHFYPFSNGNVSMHDSMFAVTTNNLKLLSKFNSSEEILQRKSYLQSLGSNASVFSLTKEYFLSIGLNGLSVEFTPTSGSFAFVNAIELVPAIYNLFFNSATRVDSSGSLNLIDRGMETMYRLNVGGPLIDSSQDQDLWRRWETDDIYLLTANAAKIVFNQSNISYTNINDSSIAPLSVYKDARKMNDDVQVTETKFNISWMFDVHPNFEYLVRFHFCELEYNTTNRRIFRIYVDYMTAAENYDIFDRAKGMNKAYHDDYVTSISEQKNSLLLQLGPDSAAVSSALGAEGLLNGLEIFKISRNANLAYEGAIDTRREGLNRKGPRKKNVWVAIGSGIFSVFLLSGLCFLFTYFCVNKKKTASAKGNSTEKWRPLTLHETLRSTTDAGESKFTVNPSELIISNRVGRRFTISEIRTATNNFNESLVIGTGGFGKVYKGEIEEGMLVAVKRAHPESKQGIVEFETEIEMLSKLRHRHLVSMIGYCDEQNEMILVYEYMANGTLRNHLFGSDLPPLSWKQRLQACIGAARGLHYLHTGAERAIIHRDVKTTNILLDEKFVAKMADFGLSKTGPSLEHTHVSTAVRGSFGYLDPEYFRRQKLTEKSDVYSFGVVLFEVVCARPVINPGLPRDEINLAEWAVRWQQQGLLQSIMDPCLDGDISLESLRKFGEIAEKCLADEGKERPTMGDVLWNLEYASQLHEPHTREGNGECSLRNEVRPTPTGSALTLITEGEEDASHPSDRIEESHLLSGTAEQHCSDSIVEAEHLQSIKPQLNLVC